ncbi:MAG: phosphoenolpyruvate carboxykinase, partial [Actinobacteria bacterium]|nr:phosphoenolpyruvate carboxykinase [Actinomycetota bacterium]
MALADTLTRTGAVGIRPLSVAGEYGRRPAYAGAGMDALAAWVDEIAALTQPARVHWINGSRAENDMLLRDMVSEGKLIKLNPEW